VSSQPRIEIQGQAPFKQSGVYEAQISITSTKPSDDEIKTKQFSHLWQGHFHLSVKDGVFSEILVILKTLYLHQLMMLILFGLL